MALGGGTFTVQNKVLPGAYFNFVSVAKASATLSDRGVATMPLELDWGVAGEVFEVTSGDFQKDSMKIFGYDYTHEKMKGLRDLFLNAKTLYVYRLNGDGAKASNAFATAKYAGIRGNDIKIAIEANADTEGYYDVITYLETTKVDKQTVLDANGLIDNDYVEFKVFDMELNAGTPLSGGTNSSVSGASHQAYLDAIESYAFNAMGVETTDETTKTLYASFNKRMREEIGLNFQMVLHTKPADYEGVVNVKNTCVEGDAKLVYWTTGVIAGCAVNKSNLNKKYDGEFTVNVKYTQKQLENAIKAGEFTFHNVNGVVRVLNDINSLVTTTDEKGDIFKQNQTIRVIDQIANDWAVIFTTKYLGVVQNDASGRVSLWNEFVKHHQQLQDIRAIENFKPEHITVEQGDAKGSVLATDLITVVNAMAQLYVKVKIA
jgi:hypothetical protein